MALAAMATAAAPSAIIRRRSNGESALFVMALRISKLRPGDIGAAAAQVEPRGSPENQAHPRAFRGFTNMVNRP
jgi:hypothetical protein